MNERLTVAEQKNKRKGRNYSIAIHVIILLLLFIFGRMPNDPEQSIDDQYAVAIDFSLERASNSTSGQEESGERPEEAEEEERAEESEPVPDVPVEEVEEVQDEVVEEEIIDEAVQEIPDPIEPEVAEVIEDESPIEAFEDPVVIDKPKKEPVPDKPKVTKPSGPSKPTTKPAKPSTKPTKPTTTGNGSGKTNTSTRPGGKTGTGKTDAGSGSGSDASGNDGNSGIGTGGHGKGEYDDSGDGIFGRRIVKIPNLAKVMQKPGRIVVKMCIDIHGNVTHTELIRATTTIKDKRVLRDALQVAKNYKYAKDFDAPNEQCGKFTFKIDMNMLTN